MDKRFPVFNSLKTRALLPDVGTPGIASCVCSVDCRMWPLGHPTEIGRAGDVFIVDVFMM